MKKILRSIQTYFPFLHDLRFKLKLWKIRRTGIPHEADFYALRLFQPQPMQVYIDIGSNRGESICSMLVTGSFKQKIIGFEPHPLIFKKLQAQFNGYIKVKVYPYGLGQKEQTLPLYVPFYRRWMFDGLSSFIYEEARGWLKTRFWRYQEKHLTIKEYPCAIRQLDGFELNPYFIKIDVQGYELEVLKGGKETLELHKPILLIEAISEGVQQFLQPLGYNFYRYEEGKFIPGLGNLNTFCLVPEKMIEISLK